MRLDFRVLWIDDQQKHIQSFSEGLRIKLKDLGFELFVIPLETIESVDQKMGEHVHHDGIDLVLVDYDLGLGKGDGGEQALTKVRKHFPYKEIVFYSATDTEKLRKIAYETKVDGVYFSTRLSLVSDTTQIIEKLLSKVLDIDHMRGVVMSATSDIDFLVEHSLLAVYKRLDIEQQSDFRKAIVAQLEGKLKDWGKDLDKAAGKDNIDAVLKLRHLFSAADKLNSLLVELDGWAADGSSYLQKVKAYRDDVVPRRNKLAHVMLKRESGRGATLVGAENWSLDDMTTLRCSLIDHRENFQNIAVLVDVQLD